MTVRAALPVVGILLLMLLGGQPARADNLPPVTEQEEADNRVIAARCGTPKFEKAFTRQSTALVASGRLSPKRRPADVEKAITALRRNPVTLISASADCPAQLERLSQLQKSRSAVIKTRPARNPGR